MNLKRKGLALACALPCSLAALADHAAPPVKDLGVVTITGPQPTSLPTQIPATMEGATRERIDRTVNATDSEDALKYFPSLLVRKRYVGDYNHAILSSRASGTGNSARSAVYADGILLSNFLGNGVGGLAFPPRWGFVTPEEIERVDVMYGPFSAAYPGNSVGAVVDYVTRMPTRLEAHARVGYVHHPFDLYATHESYRAWQASASVGSKRGDWAWWIHVNRSDSEGHPLGFGTRVIAGPPAAGAVVDRNTTGQPIYVLGHHTQYRTVQDHAKVKLAHDLAPGVRAAYTFGSWRNEAASRARSYLPLPVPVTPADIPFTDEQLTHFMHGLTVKSHTRATWDWELAASRYDYDKDLKSMNAATLADGGGTGWATLAARGTWRPQGPQGEHVVDFGVQHAGYELSYRTSTAAGAVASDVGGRTRLLGIWGQDAWRFAPDWMTVLGLRAEHWQASRGFTRIAAAPAVDVDWPARSAHHLSPKAALSYRWSAGTVLKAALGRAVRYPTVAELYGATSTVNSLFINDPALRPERSWTGELTAEREVGKALARLTFFAEDTRDALYSQSVFDPAANRNVSRVQNVGRIATRGMEFAYGGNDVLVHGLELNASLTYAHSVIRENAGFVTVPGDTVGKRQPNIPRWRATLLASWRITPGWSASAGARYSSRQFRTLDNSDTNGFTFFGVSRLFVVDVRTRWQVDRRLSVAAGIDNLNNHKHWNFHPYPQRTYVAELKADF